MSTMSPAQNGPEVSVVIATYNMGQFVADAIRSVLAQSFGELEVIVVDDGSVDDTQQALQVFADDPRVRLIRQENQGQPRAKNAGVRACRGRFIAFCDADDYWLPNKLELQLPLFADRPRVGVVYSPVQSIHEDGTIRPRSSREFFRGRVLEELFVRNLVPFGTAVVRREYLEQAGLFDESIGMGIDWDLWLRIAVNWEFDFVPEPTYVYRVWDGQMSGNWRGRYDCALRIMANFLENHPDRISPSTVARAYADTYTNLASYQLRHLGTGACLASLRKALAHQPGHWPAWRLLLLLPWRRLRSRATSA
jgi:glycosyltransferase involved in cell wall biosynthesis